MTSSTNAQSSDQGSDQATVLHSDQSGRATPAKPLLWLLDGKSRASGTEREARAESLGARLWVPEAGHDSARIGQNLLEFVQRFPGRELVILRLDCPLQESQLQQLMAWLRKLDAGGQQAVALTALCNQSTRFNPFHNLEAGAAIEPADPAGLVGLLASRRFFPANDWPDHLVCLNEAAIRLLADADLTVAQAPARLQDGGGAVLLCDCLFVHDPSSRLLTRARLENHEQAQMPAWAELSARLCDWLRHDERSATPVATVQPGATLHITHSWGGGVARWVSSLIEADAAGLHFQLRSESAESGRGAGQKLALYAGNETAAPLATWWLQPAIRSTVDRHPDYPRILQHIRQRYPIGRVIVSSLVGHSLDALRSGIPSVQVLHDYYPLWPLLGVNPLPYLRSAAGTGATPLARAMSEHALLEDFGNRDVAGWHRLAQSWLRTLQQEQVKLAAPSQSVLNLLQQLDPDWKSVPIDVIPHGVPAFTDQAAVLPKPRIDGRLRLVIPGRMQALKGQSLLLQALPELTKLAQVYLLGTGKDGEAFFGQSGVNVILQYHRDELPAILREIGPHAAALLSVVPETFSYTLSEMRLLDIPVIATRVGSLAERITDGVDGWLIDPDAAALVTQVRQLVQQPAMLEEMRHRLSQLPGFSTVEMLQRYQQLCPPSKAATVSDAETPNLASSDQLQLGAAALQAANLASRNLELQQQATSLQDEVEKRTEWAREREAALQAEQRARDAWVSSLNQEIARRDEALAHEKANLARLESTHAALQSLHESVLASSSWRLTRPLRAGRRVLANLGRARAWDPRRWPLLLSQAVRTISTSGLRGALVRAQLSPQQLSGPESGHGFSLEGIGDPTPPASLPCSTEPRVSIIIPVFNKWAYTAACLRSLADSNNPPSMEVILVDDGSTDETAAQAGQVQGLKFLRNTRNLGFVGSCNRGLEQARGEFTVLLNNDTQVLDGWLDALLDTFDRFPDTGLAGAQLLYPDGTLQEAGGIIFRDGSGWNYGKHDDAANPEYQYSREVDYCSGACIMLRTELFRSLGGFDARYAPAYYEDTDLAFRVREAGFKVRYQPAARIIHFEGITSGTDLNSGAKRYQQVNRGKFLQRWQEELQAYPAPIVNPDDQREIRRARDHRLKGLILVIDAYTPEPDQDSGSLRLSYIFDCLQQLGYGVTFFADNRGFAGRYSKALQAAGVEVLYNPWIASLQDFFRERGPEFSHVVVSRHYVAANYLALVRRYCPKAKFIFDTVDLHYLREERLAELENSLPLRRVAAQTKRSELSVIRQSDATLVVSPVEQAVLRAELPDARIEILSNIHRVAGSRAGFADRKDLFFVGGYQHPPNIDAALWFVNSIWPLVREKLPGVQFHLIGSKAPERIKSLQGDGVVFHGFVEELDPWLDGCRLAVAPLRYGAGVKGKVNMSMSRGQPVVATPVAVEGLHAVDGEDVLVAESPEEFAAAVVRLYQDRALWEKLSQGGLQNVQQYFSLEAAKGQLAALLGPV
jgi:GT2 family glycosyltransferase